MEKAKQLLLSSRPISWINTAYPFAATYFVLTRKVDVLAVAGTLFFLIPYNLLMYGINDVFDYESDLRNPRKVGVEGIILRPSLHKLTIVSAIVLCLPFVAVLLFLVPPIAIFVLTFALFFVVAYSAPRLRFKEKPFFDSVTSSLHFVGPMVFGAAIVPGGLSTTFPYMMAFFFWGMGSHAFGAVQDIKADKEAKIGSVATVIGARNTVRFSVACYLVSSAILLTRGLWMTTVIGSALIIYVANTGQFLGVTEKSAESTNTGWKRFIYINLVVGAIVTMTLILYLN